MRDPATDPSDAPSDAPATDPATDPTTDQRLDALGRNKRGRFVAGNSGNPRGRPPGIAALFRVKTGEGERVADFLLELLANEAAAHKDRLEAGRLLLAYGFGKPAEVTVNVDATPLGGTLDIDPSLLTNLARQLSASPSRQLVDVTPEGEDD